jgi:hypothetical protein
MWISPETVLHTSRRLHWVASAITAAVIVLVTLLTVLTAPL